MNLNIVTDLPKSHTEDEFGNKMGSIHIIVQTGETRTIPVQLDADTIEAYDAICGVDGLITIQPTSQPLIQFSLIIGGKCRALQFYAPSMSARQATNAFLRGYPWGIKPLKRIYKPGGIK